MSAAGHDVLVHSVALMDTVITFEVIGHGNTAAQRADRAAAVERAVGWFREVESCCTRFDPASELSALCARVGEPVEVSPLLFEAVRFALALASDTDGAFDPTVGNTMASRGFDVEYKSGATLQRAAASSAASFRDVRLDETNRTVTLDRTLMLDLGAVAKGLAVDVAARELAPLEDFAIDAGGDVYAAGQNAAGKPWAIGIRHPRRRDARIETVHVSGSAVCTSGDYERRGTHDASHIIDPRTGAEAAAVASATVIAPAAMVADGLATAAFVLGPVDGIALLERHGVRGILFTPSLERFAT